MTERGKPEWSRIRPRHWVALFIIILMITAPLSLGLPIVLLARIMPYELVILLLVLTPVGVVGLFVWVVAIDRLVND